MVKKLRFKDVSDAGDDAEFLEPASDPAPDAPAVPEVEDALNLASTPNIPDPPQPLLTLRVYAAMSGIRWDQAAGFLAYAKAMKLGPLTMEEWSGEVEKFNNRPVM